MTWEWIWVGKWSLFMFIGNRQIPPLLYWCNGPRVSDQKAQMYVQIPEQLTRKRHLQNPLPLLPHGVMASEFSSTTWWLLHWPRTVSLCVDCQHLSRSQFVSIFHATISINIRVLNFYISKYFCKSENKHNSNLILRYSESFTGVN